MSGHAALTLSFNHLMPPLLYYAGSAAFASSFCHNFLSLCYETSPIKKQLALLQCTIKGVSLLADLQLGLQGAIVLADSNKRA